MSKWLVGWADRITWEYHKTIVESDKTRPDDVVVEFYQWNNKAICGSAKLVEEEKKI